MNASCKAYDAASRSARALKWGTTFPGPNKSLENGDQKVLKARALKAVANNGYAEAAVQSWLTNMIASGVYPTSETKKKKHKKQIQKLANKWFKTCGSNGESLGALQWLALGSAVTTGECLGRFRYRRILDRLPVPLQIQLMEGDHLDDVPYKYWGKNRIKLGIEIDRLDRRVAYHLTREHPSDADFYNKHERVRVPAKDMVHLYDKKRPGQMRGVTWLSSILVVLFEIDEKETADNVRRKFNSLITAFIEDSGIVPTDNTQKLDEDGNPVDEDDEEFLADDIEPGAQILVPNGKKVTLSKPAESDPTDEAWLKAQLRKAAAGVGLQAHQITKDLTQVNYSSIRAGLIEFRRLCEALLKHFFIEQFCTPIWNKFMDTSV
ncbi:MAG: phage portal protein, partial [Endozoicomonas sp.]